MKKNFFFLTHDDAAETKFKPGKPSLELPSLHHYILSKTWVRICLHCITISSSRGSSQHRDWTPISCITGRFFIAEPPGQPIDTHTLTCIHTTHTYIYPKDIHSHTYYSHTHPNMYKHMCRFPSDTHSKCFPVAQIVKNLPAMQGAWVWFLGREDPLDKGMATYSSNFAWRFPWREEPGRLQSMGLQRVRQDGRTNTSQLAQTHMYTNSLLPCARTHTHTPAAYSLLHTHFEALVPAIYQRALQSCRRGKVQMKIRSSNYRVCYTHFFVFFVFFQFGKPKRPGRWETFLGVGESISKTTFKGVRKTP